MKRSSTGSDKEIPIAIYGDSYLNFSTLPIAVQFASVIVSP